MRTQTMKDFAVEFRTELAGPYGRSMIGAFLALLAIILPLIWTNLTMGVVMGWSADGVCGADALACPSR